MISRKFARAATVAASLAVVGLGSVLAATPASAGDDVSCFTGGDSSCVSGTLPANGNHTVCFGGQNTALGHWGNVELWDLDTAQRVGYQATSGWQWQQKCVGGLYGSHYYVVGHSNYLNAEAWN
ncbi:hypothetical protein Lfu02_60250 [Longispora fulva]|uniref:Secreted protein n=1 Tax=Longispora fulva TaxID=619741 RepID=A0A8J7GQC3_9ACTN|nr:hypothetical protein [Longispora fulva]MBG6136994.1 hypothetical protein [Longispora fulva]GIG61653.1 hypothetical protein Lfu02_60250 [Longispora fulva]